MRDRACPRGRRRSPDPRGGPQAARTRENAMKAIWVTLFLAVLGFAPPAFAQSTSYDIEVGYQSVDVEGNEDMFRTQINQDDGFVLRGFTINLIDPTGEMGIADRLRIDASGFGGDPA